MMFPYSFGFIPSTEGDDGDPLDGLVLMDEPVFPGCILSCRPIGVIEGEQYDGKETERNDRILAVEQQSHEWAHITTAGIAANIPTVVESSFSGRFYFPCGGIFWLSRKKLSGS
jgi:inorganic pyrophosphatase